MHGLKLGDEVLAPWAQDGFLYPAVLVELDGQSAHVAYLDGDEAEVDASTLRRGVIGPGLHVNVSWKGRRVYYNGVIRKRIAQAIYLDYEDGDHGWATLSQCRVRASVLEEVQPHLIACTWCGAAMDAGETVCPTCHAPRRMD